MKRIVGSLAALTLALSLGVAAYGKAAPKQNQPANQTAPAKKTSHKKHSSKKKKHSTHHKGHSKTKSTKSTTTPPKK
jgi:uncharacterized low-complexity protein